MIVRVQNVVFRKRYLSKGFQFDGKRRTYSTSPIQSFLSLTLLAMRSAMRKQGVAGVLQLCPALSELSLQENQIDAEGAGRGVLPQCPALHELNLSCNQIGADGSGGVTGVLPQCPRLSLLDLGGNQIGANMID
jgi:Leucine-rich repeat (LRR) protein